MTLSHCSAAPDLATSSQARTFDPRTVFSNIVGFVADRIHHRFQRKAFRKMLAFDDRILKDIGVTRGDVYWASELPLEINAGEELRLYSKRYPRNG